MGGIVALSILPDVAQMLPLLGWLAVGDGSLQSLYRYAVAQPGTEPWLPPLLQALVHHLHCIGHSAFVAGAATLLAWFLRRRWTLVLLGWWLHIVIDIFTHSAKYYAVPVLYPFSYRGFDGVAWTDPRFMAVNYVSLAVVFVWLFRTRKRAKLIRSDGR
jgi:hypothetical protein